jgi:hypothetical protein
MSRNIIRSHVVPKTEVPAKATRESTIHATPAGAVVPVAERPSTKAPRVFEIGAGG